MKLLGNIISTSRGETVKPETLGVGDSSIANQSFTLKKSPLTYLPSPSENTPSGLTSTLKVRRKQVYQSFGKQLEALYS